jgi:hypothetical protein
MNRSFCSTDYRVMTVNHHFNYRPYPASTFYFIYKPLFFYSYKIADWNNCVIFEDNCAEYGITVLTAL